MTAQHDAGTEVPLAATPGEAETDQYERYLLEQQRTAAMAEGNGVSVDHVREVILADLDRRTRRVGNWQVEPVGRARESWLFKGFTPLAPWPVAIKVFSTAMPDRFAVRQHKALKRYHEAMASRPGLTVPAPWAVLRPHHTLIMEWIDEPRADIRLRQAGRSERSRIIAAAGRWLRHFHDQRACETRPLSPLELLRPVDTPLGGNGAGASVRDRVFATAYHALARHAHECAGTPIDYVKSHGDFTPANLFHGPQRTVGFDFLPGPTEPAARDILHFLAFADFERPLMTRGPLLLSSSTDKQDLNAFLTAYGPLEQCLDERLLGLFRLAEVLRRWAFLLDRMRRFGINWKNLATTLRLRRMAKGTAEELNRRRGSKS